MWQGSVAAARLRYAVSGELVRAAGSRGVAFCQLGRDAATESFLSNLALASPGKVVAHSLARMFMSHYDANALLGMYPLHLLSADQLDKLLHCVDGDRDKVVESAIDVGAGDGSMTHALLLPRAQRVMATETSRRMTQRARERGVDCVTVDITDPDWATEQGGLGGAPFDLALLLNVLDRTKRPRTMLERLAGLLKPGGSCVLATPLPMRPHCYDGARVREPVEALAGPLPSAELNAAGLADDWERAAFGFLTRVLDDSPLRPLAFARVPYLSAGDLTRPLVVYDDIVVVCALRSSVGA